MLILLYLEDWLLCARLPQQAFVTSCHYLGLEGKPLEKLPNPKPVSVLSGHSLELQVNESHSHRWQKAGIVEDLSEVPGSLQTALYQLPTTGRPSHSGLTSYPAGPFGSLSIPMLVDSQASFANSQLAHACSDHDQLCCLSDSGGRTHFFKEVYQLGHHHWEVVSSDASLNGWGGLWQHRGIWGSWDPQLVASHINLLELWAVLFTLRHFRQELSGRHILVRTDNTTVPSSQEYSYCWQTNISCQS